MTTDGYTATNQLAAERPDLLPLLCLILDMGDREFGDGLRELERRGLIEMHDSNEDAA